VGLNSSNLPDPSAERLSIPIKGFGTYLRRYWQILSVLNLEENLKRNSLTQRQCGKWLFVSGAQLSLFQSSWALLMTLTRPFLEYVQKDF